MSRPPWLSAMSEKWEVTHPKAIFRERNERSRSEDIHLTPSQSHGVLPQTEYMQITGSRVVLNLTGQDNMKHVEPNDFIIHLRSFQGGIEHSAIAGKVSNAYTVLTPAPAIDPRFYKWVLKSSGYIQELNASTNQLRDGQSIKFADFAAIDLPLPPVDEQRRIADFLDDQVARIDSLIQSRVRQQVLHHASYLEQVRYLTSHGAPSTWRVAHAFMTGSGTTPKSDHPEYFEGATPWVMSGDLNDGLVNETEKAVSAEALEVYSALKVYPPGTLLVAMYGATVGRTGRLGVSACVNQAVCALQERGPVLAEYAQYWFVGRRTEIIELASGGGQPNISQEIVRNLRITTGDANWQRDRIHSIRRVATQIEDIISTGMRSVDLLEERKRALITAAVTGELDVTTARPIGMGKWVPNVGASVEAPAAAKASSIGGVG